MKLILVVEDHDILREALALGLQQEGFKVLAARNFEEGSRLLKSYNFDFAVIDITLPTRSGTELAAQAKCPLVLMTGYNNIKNVSGYKVLKKPFELLDLVKEIPA